MGKRGPKPSFVDVPCPNKDCEDYGKINNENVVGNGHLWDEKMVLLIDIFVERALKASSNANTYIA